MIYYKILKKKFKLGLKRFTNIRRQDLTVDKVLKVNSFEFRNKFEFRSKFELTK